MRVISRSGLFQFERNPDDAIQMSKYDKDAVMPVPDNDNIRNRCHEINSNRRVALSAAAGGIIRHVGWGARFAGSIRFTYLIFPPMVFVIRADESLYRVF
jgi:hypothetical protein